MEGYEGNCRNYLNGLERNCVQLKWPTQLNLTRPNFTLPKPSQVNPTQLITNQHYLILLNPTHPQLTLPNQSKPYPPQPNQTNLNPDLPSGHFQNIRRERRHFITHSKERTLPSNDVKPQGPISQYKPQTRHQHNWLSLVGGAPLPTINFTCNLLGAHFPALFYYSSRCSSPARRALLAHRGP